MKKEQMKDYIRHLLNKTSIEEEEAEIQNVILLLVVYMAGLERKPFPLKKINLELEAEKEIPQPFHTLIARLAIIKSKIEQRTNNPVVLGLLSKNSNELLEDFKTYFLT